MSNPTLRLSTRVRGVSPYATPIPAAPIDLRLDANEGPPAPIDLAAIARLLPDGEIARYPSARALEAALAARWSVEPQNILVTSGGDDAIHRACQAVLEPSRDLILPMPTFEMIPRYATLAGARIIEIPWPRGPYPASRICEAVTAQTAMIALVSPNNPTGAVATRDDLERICRAAPHALVLVDAAYAEFADEDLTEAAISLPNTLVVRTFSKALGCAGLRVGYCVGPADLITALRAAGGPYPVSSLSLLVARHALETSSQTLSRVVPRIRDERAKLSQQLARRGADVFPSQANFVLAQFTNAPSTWAALASQGILVRRFSPASGLERCLRITLPGSASAFDRLTAAFETALRPQREGMLP
ncbi:MAG: histidinol-phosphate transaminase [Phycisphaerae bacterium]|nr:histidinol-phosphate transaminase [Phycisphaerae bacterium]